MVELTRKYLKSDQKPSNNLKAVLCQHKKLLWRKGIDKLCFDGSSKQLIVHSQLMFSKMNLNIDTIETVTVFFFIDHVTQCLAVNGQMTVFMKLNFSLS